MRRYALLLFFSLFFPLSGTSQGVIVQHFDSTGALSQNRGETPPAPAHRSEKYSVAQEIGMLPGVRYEFYPVFGKTFAEIVKSAEENGPIDKRTGRRTTSVFEWAIGWSYEFTYQMEYEEEDDKLHCSISLYDVSLLFDITITLPVLTDDSSLNAIEKELWRGYIANILKAEHGRVKIVRDDARDDILRRLDAMDYLVLDAEQEADAEDLVARYVREQTARGGRDAVRQIGERLDHYEEEVRKAAGKAPGRRERKVR